MHFPRATRIDLLHTEHLYRYRSNPALIRADLAGLRAGDWVVVDEAQKVPDLLDEIHGLYESRRLHFAITSSSARKLRRADVNLLAGRAVRRDFFPLVWAEIEQPSLLGACLDHGTLPPVLADPVHAADTLASYVGTYLQEEIAAEALTRDVQPFSRFLQVGARHHAQVLNVERVAQQAAIKRRTVDTYFELLEDTLLGFRLPAFRPRVSLPGGGPSEVLLLRRGRGAGRGRLDSRGDARRKAWLLARHTRSRRATGVRPGPGTEKNGGKMRLDRGRGRWWRVFRAGDA